MTQEPTQEPTLARVDDLGDRLVVVNMNIAARGAISPELYTAIRDAMDRAQDPRIRAVILTAEGGYFCAGGNLKSIQERRTLPEAERKERIEILHGVSRSIRTAPVPVIAAIEGGAAGAGLSIALACDLVVAAENATFTAAYVKAGLVPDGGLTSALARVMPRPMAMEMCLFGRAMPAERLLEIGAINQIVPAGEVDAAAQALADALARGPREAQASIRALVSSGYDQTEAAQLDAERDGMARAQGSWEAGEGIAAFIEKRRPDFTQ